MTEDLKEKIKDLLKSKSVEIVLGFQRASDGINAAPLFIEDVGDVEKLIYDEECIYNLSVYLPELKDKRIAILANPSCKRAINVLIQENQIEEKNITIIDTDELYKLENIDADIERLEQESFDQRWQYWQNYFSRCIKCYACRQICPMCYCPTCVAEQTMPQWFSKATSLEGNFAWNITRAFHLAGRCIDCGECERACPVGIPLREINNKIIKDVKELFRYEAGMDTKAKPLLANFDKDDPEEFIR